MGLDLDWLMLSIIAGVVAAVNGLTMWAIKTMITRDLDRMAKQSAGFAGDLKSLRKDLNELKLGVARDYVHRNDFVMWSSRIEQKIDAVWSFLYEEKRHHGPG